MLQKIRNENINLDSNILLNNTEYRDINSHNDENVYSDDDFSNDIVDQQYVDVYNTESNDENNGNESSINGVNSDQSNSGDEESEDDVENDIRDDLFGFDQDWKDAGQEKIYPDLECTKIDLMLMILIIYLKHNLT